MWVALQSNLHVEEFVKNIIQLVDTIILKTLSVLAVQSSLNGRKYFVLVVMQG